MKLHTKCEEKGNAYYGWLNLHYFKKYPLKPHEWLAWLILMTPPFILVGWFSVAAYYGLRQDDLHWVLLGLGCALFSIYMCILFFTNVKRVTWITIYGAEAIATLAKVGTVYPSPTMGRIGEAEYEYHDASGEIHVGRYGVDSYFFLPYREKPGQKKLVLYNPLEPCDSDVIAGSIGLLRKFVRYIFKPKE